MNINSDKTKMSATEFALLGGGEVAYVREISSDRARNLIDGLPENLPGDVRLFGVYAADGTCMAITDSEEAALVNVWEQDLHPLSVH